MKYLKKLYFPYALFIALAAFLLSNTGVAANTTIHSTRTAPLATQQCGKWSVVSSPNVDTGDTAFGAVTVISTNDVWAVGNLDNANTSIATTLTEHWNGKSWSIVKSPDFGPFGNTLYGVAGTSSHDVWAVGYAIGKNNFAQTLIEHWNGTSWNIVSSPNPGDSYNLLYSVSALSANNAWAVGFEQDKGHTYTLVEHWNGTNWQAISSQNPGISSNVLYSVKAVATNNVWAVGQYFNTSGPDGALVEHWNGTSWSVASPPDTTSSAALFGVTATATNVWAAGQIGGVNAPTEPLVAQRDSAQWSLITAPHSGAYDNVLYAIATAASNDIWAVGQYVDVAGNAYTLIEHSDGQNWKVVSSPSPGVGGNSILGGIAVASPHDIWAVGGYDTGDNTMSLVEHYC